MPSQKPQHKAVSFLIRWNNRFLYDREYRKKYNIGFNSPEHRKLSPIDIYFDILEDKIVEKRVEEFRQLKIWEEEIKADGIWLIDRMTPEEREKKNDELFEKLRKGIKSNG